MNMTDIYQHTSRLIVLFEEFLHYEYLIQQIGAGKLLTHEDSTVGFRPCHQDQYQ